MKKRNEPEGTVKKLVYINAADWERIQLYYLPKGVSMSRLIRLLIKRQLDNLAGKAAPVNLEELPDG